MVAFPVSGTDKAIYSNAEGNQWTAAAVDAGFIAPTCIVKCKGKLGYFIALGNGDES